MQRAEALPLPASWWCSRAGSERFRNVGCAVALGLQACSLLHVMRCGTAVVCLMG